MARQREQQARPRLVRMAAALRRLVAPTQQPEQLCLQVHLLGRMRLLNCVMVISRYIWEKALRKQLIM